MEKEIAFKNRRIFKFEGLMNRDAPIISNGRLSAVLPIIGISGLARWYRLIVVYTKMYGRS